MRYFLLAFVMLSASVHAVTLNHEHLGQVLLFPYYTTQGGHKTLISVVNTTDQTKVVKVRFLEGFNSREVLNFNLFLSPADVWVGAVEQNTDTGGARLFTPDTSCTVLQIPSEGAAFRDFEYTGANDDNGPQGLERTREGHFEIIEMGVIDEDEPGGEVLARAAAHHPDGTDCQALFLAYVGSPFDEDTGVGLWSPFAGGHIENAVDAPRGGLYGTWEVIHIEEGGAVGGTAVALASFFVPENPDDSLHAIPGTLSPNLNDAYPRQAQLLDVRQGEEPRLVSAEFERGVDSVSAVLMRSAAFTPFTVNDAVGGGTASIFSFPTKAWYVNDLAKHPAQASGALGQSRKLTLPLPPARRQREAKGASFGTTAPFTAGSFRAGVVPGQACEQIIVFQWDQEEAFGIGSPADFSPSPPLDERFSLCWETNVVGFGTAGHSLHSSMLEVVLPVFTDFQNGHALFELARTFNETGTDLFVRALTSLPDELDRRTRFFGLPVIGATLYSRMNDGVGIGAQYESLFEHAYTRCLQSGTFSSDESQPLGVPERC